MNQAPAFLLALSVVAAVSAAGPAAANPLYRPDLGPPFDSWNVTVTSDEANPQVLRVEFDSGVLGRRATNAVFVPDAYLDSGAAFPVAYYLHGVVSLPRDDNPAHELTDRDFLLWQASSGHLQIEIFGFDETLDRANYLVVAPDSAEWDSWCTTCVWIDGKDDQGVDAESFLHRELMPLVEQLFHVRTDRGGRGVFGHSMGGWGALVQGFRHPDVFRFVGAFSPVADAVHNPVLAGFAPSFLRTQGYGERTNEAWYRNFNPLDLVPQIAGQRVDLWIAVGDGCVESRPSADCAGAPADSSAALEAILRENNDAATSTMTELGVPFTYVRTTGVHGAFNRHLYASMLVDRMNRAFAESIRRPATFSYKTVDHRFSIWGYEIAVDRRNAEFLNVLGARVDGRSFTLAGTGTAAVLTPSAFRKGKAYRVRIAREGEEPTTDLVEADASGRLLLERVPLGAARAIDELKAAVDRGQHRFPQTRVEIEEP